MHGVVSYKFEYKLENEADYKLGKEIDSSKNSCNYTYIDLTQEVVNNLKVTATDNKGNSKESTLDVTPEKLGITMTEADIGKTVDYTPSGGEYSIPQFDGKNVGYSGASAQTLKTQGQKSGEIPLGWKIWSIDSNNISLISDEATSSKLVLNGDLGYNNSVTLLDKICETCYQNLELYPKMKTRNLKLDDLIAGTVLKLPAELSYERRSYHNC